MSTGTGASHGRITDELSVSRPAGASTSYSTLVAAGSVQRVASERAAAVKYDAGGALLGVQSAGRAVELFRCTLVLDSSLMTRFYGVGL